MKRLGFFFVLGAICLIPSLLPAYFGGQGKRLTDIYKTGNIHLIPEITITDETFGGKDFFTSATDIAIDGTGAIYVCDSQGNNIKKFDAQGKYLRTIGKQGQGPGDFSHPSEIEITGGHLYVRELNNDRISILDFEGAFIKSVPLSREGGIIWWRISTLPDGRFVVEKEKMNYGVPNALQECYIELYSSDLVPIKILYQRQVRKYKYITEPRRTMVPIPFSPWVYWDTAPDGKIIIGFSDKFEAEVHDPDKGKISAFSFPYKQVEVSPEAKARYFEGMGSASGGKGGLMTIQRGAPDFIVKNTEFPKYYPPYRDIKIDPEMNIWIRPYLNGAEASKNFDVFDREGKFISRVRIEGDAQYPGKTTWTSDGFWTITWTKDEEYQIKKYKISG